MTLALPIAAEANALLRRSPLALLVAMILDQQVPLEKAFSSPYDLAQRLGHEPTAEELATMDLEALTAVFAERPALHRFPKAMAARVQEACRLVVERYDGDVAQVWRGAADGADALRRIAELPGFGRQKAQIFVALLGKRFDVRPPGWREAAGTFGENGTHYSVADITDDASLLLVREHKQRMKVAGKAGSADPAEPNEPGPPARAQSARAGSATEAAPAAGSGATSGEIARPAAAARAGARAGGEAESAGPGKPGRGAAGRRASAAGSGR